MSKKTTLVLTVIMVLIVSFFLSACESKDASTSPSDSSETSGTETETVSPDESTPADTASTDSGAETSGEENAEASPSDSASASPSDSAEASPSESASSSASTSSDPNTKKFDGYLVDVKCADKGKDTHGNDMTKEPMKHTVACLKSNSKSGYGLYIGQGNDTFKFYPFDDNGNKMIKRYIIDKTEKTDNMRVAVRGALGDDGKTIKVTTVLNYGLKD